MIWNQIQGSSKSILRAKIGWKKLRLQIWSLRSVDCPLPTDWSLPGSACLHESSASKPAKFLRPRLNFPLASVFPAPPLGQEAALPVSKVLIGPPGEAVENNFNAACGLGPLCWVRGRVLTIENTPSNQDHADSSYCLAFLKLFIPAIASPTLSPSSVLKWSSVTISDRRMVQEDWIDFVYRLTTKFDNQYVPGALSDPGDLLEYVLSIVPGIAQMCTMTWTTTPSCGCRMARKEILTEECGLLITLSSN